MGPSPFVVRWSTTSGKSLLPLSLGLTTPAPVRRAPVVRCALAKSGRARFGFGAMPVWRADDDEVKTRDFLADQWGRAVAMGWYMWQSMRTQLPGVTSTGPHC